MADTVYPENVHIERPFGWKTWRVTPGTLTGTVDVPVATLPDGTTILDAKMVVIQAEAGATSTDVDVEVGATGAGDTALLNGAADFAGTLGAVENTVTEGNLGTINAVSLGGSDLVVNAQFTFVGTATTEPIVEIHILCGRNVLP